MTISSRGASADRSRVPERRGRRCVRPALQLRQRDEHAPQVRLPDGSACSAAAPRRTRPGRRRPLARDQVRERRREQPRVVELRDAGASRVRHRRAGVDRDLRRQVRRLAVLLRVEAVGPGEQLPVDVLQIVAGPVVAVLAELRAVAVKGAAVQAGDRAVDRDPRDELEVADRRQEDRGRACSEAPDDCYAGMCSSRRPTIWSASMPSASAWKFRRSGGAGPAARPRGCPRAPRRCGLRAARAPCRRAAAPARRADPRPSGPTCVTRNVSAPSDASRIPATASGASRAPAARRSR